MLAHAQIGQHVPQSSFLPLAAFTCKEANSELCKGLANITTIRQLLSFTWQSLEQLLMPCCNIFKKEKDDYAGQELTPDFSF